MLQYKLKLQKRLVTIKNHTSIEAAKKYLPLVVLLLIISASFFYGWYFDGSKPQGGIGWADQTIYTNTAQGFYRGDLPSSFELTYAIGYPVLGAIGALVIYSDPFMVVSLILLLASVIFCFLAVRKLFGVVWASFFTVILFMWDLEAKTFNFASELFTVPWNNQVLFFALSFFFWLLATQINVKSSLKLTAVASIVAGYSITTREEAILFVIPLLFCFLILNRRGLKHWVLAFSVIAICLTPQLITKWVVLGSPFSSGRGNSYGDVKSEYLQPSLLYRNTWEVIIDSRKYVDKPLHPVIAAQCVTPGACSTEPNRQSLLQEAPWLWLAPFGLALFIFKKKYPLAVKLYIIVSVGLMVFYLSGGNMAAIKLKFHTLRYISPAFIALNFGVVVMLNETHKFIGESFSKQRSRTKA